WPLRPRVYVHSRFVGFQALLRAPVGRRHLSSLLTIARNIFAHRQCCPWLTIIGNKRRYRALIPARGLYKKVILTETLLAFGSDGVKRDKIRPRFPEFLSPDFVHASDDGGGSGVVMASSRPAFRPASHPSARL